MGSCVSLRRRRRFRHRRRRPRRLIITSSKRERTENTSEHTKHNQPRMEGVRASGTSEMRANALVLHLYAHHSACLLWFACLSVCVCEWCSLQYSWLLEGVATTHKNSDRTQQELASKTSRSFNVLARRNHSKCV